MQFKKLDRNLKSENSENDLLRYLQSKQLRTRRLSQALWNQPVNESQEIPQDATRLNVPRKSIAPIATNNYRRRLSLAVPDDPQFKGRKRGKSAGYVLKGIDSPARRRLRLRKGAASSVCSDDRSESTNLFPLSEEDEHKNGNHEKVNFDLDFTEKEDKPSPRHTPESPRRVPDSPKRRTSPKLRSQHGSLRRSQTDEGTPPRRKSGSLRGLASRPDSSCSKGAKSPSSPDKGGIKFVSPKDSPSAARRKVYASGKTSKPDSEEHIPELSPKSRIHKNLSYNRALTIDIMEHPEEEDD